jgi:hypothetical protein
MSTDVSWRAHQRTADDLPDRNLFPGRPIDEETESTDDSWSSTFDDITQQFPELPSYVGPVGLAAAAAAGGMVLGYWLGGRRASRRHSPFSFADVDLADFAKLAPEVAHLMKNPLVRAYVSKVALRQLRRWLEG